MRAHEATPAARLFKALGDPTRVRIVALLSQGELCVCHIESALEVSQPAVSRQLTTLRAAGIVEARREGSWIHYRLARQADKTCAQLLQALSSRFRRSPALKKRLDQLRRAMGPGACR